jgi:DNA helicase II / ATP-dependent DNA helicase PcrA
MTISKVPAGRSGPLASDLQRLLSPPEPAARERHLEELLGSLNTPQRLVATRPAGPLLVVAGPGAGKTRAIVARIAHLLVARAVPPRQIMALTFSRRAAGELQSRIAAVVPTGPNDTGTVWAGTFHALGARILRHGGAALSDRPAHFTIYDRDDTDRTLRRILGELEVQQHAVGRLLSPARQAISLAKRRTEPPADGEMLGEGESSVSLADVYRRYEQELRDSAAFDFDDLICAAAQALDRDQRLREWTQGFARHLLVDEYQDTDPAQEALLQLLSPPPHDLCVVADPQQSIYAFRGAAPEQVQRFLEHWPNAGVIRLEQNYRSTKSIVAIARRLVAPFARPASAARSGAAKQLSLHLRLWTDNPPGLPSRLWVAPNPEKEAGAIAQDIAVKVESGYRPDDIAVLVRTHAQARPIEAALLRAKVPYVLVGGVRFYAREEVKDLLAYLRAATLTEDSAAFWRIVNTPRRGLGPKALLTIARHQVTSGGGPLHGARQWATTEGAPDGLYDLLANLDELAALERSGAGPRKVLEAAIALTSYRDYVRKQHPDDAPARLEAIGELLRIAETYAGSRRFLDEAVLSSEEDDPRPTALGRVRVSTVHAAKGLEFRAVFVPGCEHGLFPLAPSRREAGEDRVAVEDPPPIPAGPPSSAVTHHFAPGADPEERRVFYVAVTRAMEELTLSYCTFRRDSRTKPSPYLREIGSGLLRRAKLGTSDPPTPKRKSVMMPPP